MVGGRHLLRDWSGRHHQQVEEHPVGLVERAADRTENRRQLGRTRLRLKPDLPSPDAFNLLHSPLTLVAYLMGTRRGCQQIGSAASRQPDRKQQQRPVLSRCRGPLP